MGRHAIAPEHVDYEYLWVDTLTCGCQRKVVCFVPVDRSVARLGEPVVCFKHDKAQHERIESSVLLEQKPLPR